MSTTRYRYAIVGTGRRHGTEGATGYGMAHPHVEAFLGTGRADLVAIADTSESNARHFLETHNQPQARIFSDYRNLLAEDRPDILSICVWPHLHAEIAVAACEAGVPAVHCEKPMATTWADAKRMSAAAAASGTILTFNHQRRFLEPFQTAKRMVANGDIGALQRIEAACGDMYDWGTHWVDMTFFFNDEGPAEWVLGQIDSRTDRRVFGASIEDQGMSLIKFMSGVRATLVTGTDMSIGTSFRLIGSEGVVEIGWDSVVRVRAGDVGWRVVPTTESIHGEIAIPRAAADLVRALDDPSHQPLMAAENALRASEVIFATYESSRRRGRVDLPLQVEDNAFTAMLKSGEVGPNRR